MCLEARPMRLDVRGTALLTWTSLTLCMYIPEKKVSTPRLEVVFQEPNLSSVTSFGKLFNFFYPQFHFCKMESVSLFYKGTVGIETECLGHSKCLINVIITVIES